MSKISTDGKGHAEMSDKPNEHSLVDRLDKLVESVDPGYEIIPDEDLDEALDQIEKDLLEIVGQTPLNFEKVKLRQAIREYCNKQRAK